MQRLSALPPAPHIGPLGIDRLNPHGTYTAFVAAARKVCGCARGCRIRELRSGGGAGAVLLHEISYIRDP
jgi:hypothetical protein